MEEVKRQWQDSDTIHAYFGKRRKRAIEKYEHFVEEGVKGGERDISEGEEVDKAELRSGLRKKTVVKVRRMLCQIAVKRMGYSGADVARFLGITTSAVNRLAVSDQLPEIEKYL
jgi:hypothetical protein